MAGKVKTIPEGYHTMTAALTVNDAARAIDFYKRAFGAEEKFRMEGPQGKIGHAELKIGDSILMLGDEMPGMGNRAPSTLGGSPVNLFLYVNDVDAAFKRAVDAGAKVDMPLADMFWGDRYGKLTDPFGHTWSMATHKEDVAPEEMKKRADAAMAKMSQQTKTAS
jgi:PhnB protein